MRVNRKGLLLDKFLPKCIDNKYRGQKLALWLFAVVVVVKILQSVSVLSDAYSIAMYADGIPLDTYAPAAAQTVVAIFAVASLYRLLICVVCVLVLVRYLRHCYIDARAACCRVPGERIDLPLHSTRPNGYATGPRRQPGAVRFDSGWPGIIAVEPGQSR